MKSVQNNFNKTLIKCCIKLVQTSNLSKARETRDNLSSFCSQFVLVCLQPFQRSSLLKCAPLLSQPKIAKYTRTCYLGDLGSFIRSSLINVETLKSSSAVLVMICSTCVPIYNRFHAGRFNSSKKNNFTAYPV